LELHRTRRHVYQTQHWYIRIYTSNNL